MSAPRMFHLRPQTIHWQRRYAAKQMTADTTATYVLAITNPSTLVSQSGPSAINSEIVIDRIIAGVANVLDPGDNPVVVYLKDGTPSAAGNRIIHPPVWIGSELGESSPGRFRTGLNADLHDLAVLVGRNKALWIGGLTQTLAKPVDVYFEYHLERRND